MTDTTTSPPGRLLFLYAETPLHVGAGGEGLGAVDLPIAREQMSRTPIVPGSGLKGCIRERLEPRQAADDPKTEALARIFFGPRPPEGDQKEDEHWAGAVSFFDARLLLFPARALQGGWAWVTCPAAIDRLRRDIEMVGLTVPAALKFDTQALDFTVGQEKADACYVGPDSANVIDTGKKSLVIEDLLFAVKTLPAVKTLAEWLAANALQSTDGYAQFRARLPKQLMIVSDTEFARITQRFCELNTRVRIDRDTGTVAKGALWTEENLPAEALLSAPLQFEGSYDPDDDTREASKDKRANTRKTAGHIALKFCEALDGLPRLRLGGNRTVGRGVMALRVWGS